MADAFLPDDVGLAVIVALEYSAVRGRPVHLGWSNPGAPDSGKDRPPVLPRLKVPIRRGEDLAGLPEQR
ncbi:hypothetical protein [Streptomyces sp. NPDC058297]|uniref:hypothetical protein n=1 Tax=unclassified Streptomyces TaxID=2593676 RepID=UPI0036F05CFF